MERAEQFLSRCLWLRDAAGVWSLNPDWQGRPEYVAALPEYTASLSRRGEVYRCEACDKPIPESRYDHDLSFGICEECEEAERERAEGEWYARDARPDDPEDELPY